MAYIKQNWKNKGEVGAIPINKDNLNHIENGIESINEKIEGTEWKTITHEKGALSYKIIGNVLYLNGSFSNVTSAISISIPNVTLLKVGYVLCSGNGTYYTKCAMNTNGTFQLFVGTGNASTSYNVCCSFPIN